MSALELKIPPLLLVLLTGGAMWCLAWSLPALWVALPMRWPLAVFLFVAGFASALAGVIAFRRARTTVDPMHPGNASRVVRSGIYRFSRHPMYVGVLLLLAGWGVLLANVAAWLSLPVFVLWMNRFQIAPEERALRARFGEEYEAYLRAVRRWLWDVAQ